MQDPVEPSMSLITVFSSDKPWPPIRVERQNPCYAKEILSDIGACNSEMSAISLYLYNNAILTDSDPEYARIFQKIAIVEMHHFNVFSHLAFFLGADPRLWAPDNGSLRYWSPSCNNYPTAGKALWENALAGEEAAISRYCCQARQIDDAYVTDLLERVLLDEQIHVRIFRRMLAQTG